MTGETYWIRYGPVNRAAQMYQVVQATVTHVTGKKMRVEYRTIGGQAKKAWKTAGELYTDRGDAQFPEDAGGW